MNKTSEPEGGNRITTITLRNSSGNSFIGIPVTHGHETGKTSKEGTVSLSHINGSPITAYGTILKGVQEGVENIFQYDVWKGGFKKIS